MSNAAGWWLRLAPLAVGGALLVLKGFFCGLSWHLLSAAEKMLTTHSSTHTSTTVCWLVSQLASLNNILSDQLNGEDVCVWGGDSRCQFCICPWVTVSFDEWSREEDDIQSNTAVRPALHTKTHWTMTLNTKVSLLQNSFRLLKWPSRGPGHHPKR